MGLDIHAVPKLGGQRKLSETQNPLMMLRTTDASNLNAAASDNEVLWDTHIYLPLGIEHDVTSSKGIVTTYFGGVMFVCCQVSFLNSGGVGSRYAGDLKLVKNGSPVAKISCQGLTLQQAGSLGGAMQLGPVPIACASGDQFQIKIDRSTNASSSFLISRSLESYWAMWYFNQ